MSAHSPLYIPSATLLLGIQQVFNKKHPSYKFRTLFQEQEEIRGIKAKEIMWISL
jgi:hypothetical protein